MEGKLAQSSAVRDDLRFGSPVLREALPDYGSGRGATGAYASAPSGAADLDDAIWKLEQERIRNDNLMQLNRDLRNELDETRKLNGALSSDLQKLSDDWEKLTRQMNERENLWRAEEQAYSDYYASEHSKLLALWKKVAATKRDFVELKSASERDMSQLKNSLARISNQITAGMLSTSVSTPSPQQVTNELAQKRKPIYYFQYPKVHSVFQTEIRRHERGKLYLNQSKFTNLSKLNHYGSLYNLCSHFTLLDFLLELLQKLDRVSACLR